MQDKLTTKPHASDGKQKRASILDASDTFVHRHIGPRTADVDAMLAALGYASLDALIDDTIPRSIRMQQPLDLGPPRGEHEAIHDLRALAKHNDVYRSCIGMGYSGTITPAVIQRNVLENPGWYTQYTPYQAEIAQGRLEALLNFQTLVADLTGLPIANASLLDESTAAAEAMVMCHAIAGEKNAFFIASDCHPQTIALVRARAEALQIQVVVGPVADLHLAASNVCGALLQYPNTYGHVVDHRTVIDGLHAAGALAVVATDLLALTLLTPPGEFGADIAVGSTQRFGVPMGFGGPHAAFLATHEEHVRKMPGRIVGVSKDAHGHIGYRLTLQTREQHIRRDKATSNICTAQALPAILASMYAVYHGPDGLRRIARRVFAYARALSAGLRKLGYDPGNTPFFDTLSVQVRPQDAKKIVAEAQKRRVNLRAFDDETVGISLDETTTRECACDVLLAFAAAAGKPLESTLGAPAAAGAGLIDSLLDGDNLAIPAPFARSSAFLTHPVFNTHHSETEMLRYMAKLQDRDLALNRSMIPLGSCTMKLNGTTEMMPITWPEFAHLHPFAPREQTAGYAQLFRELEAQLAEITGFAAVSLQPNSGAQGEYAGLLVIRAYHKSRNEAHRDVCLIPVTAHGTNPASAVSAGFRVVAVTSDAAGNIDIADLRKKASEHRDRLGAFMITYPSTAGVFEENVREFCNIVHENGGLVYMDGANLNAQVGLCRPGDIGADVCHLNLHKTFCIPHGGGGPGMGPIGVTKALSAFLPGHPVMRPLNAGDAGVGPVAAAPYGSPMILPISYMYIVLMGGAGLTRASQVAILNANYMAKRLSGHFDILYSGRNGRVAHEFIVDLRPFSKSAGVQIDDVAKRLMDYGFHAPTMSWPVPGTLMVEPTESESKPELDRFCEAMIAIREEIRAVEIGTWDREDNPLKNAPHTPHEIAGDVWKHPYSRDVAAFPAPWVRESKYWPPVGRIDNYYGDRNVFCTCPPVEAYGS